MAETEVASNTVKDSIALTGTRKAAIMLVSLEEEVASEIFKKLNEIEAEEVTRAIANLGAVLKDEIDAVMAEFMDFATAHGFVREGGVDYAVRLIEKSFSPDKASQLRKIIESSQTRVEGYNFDIRKHLLDYDDVVSKHREIIYSERNKILQGADLKANIQDMVHQELEAIQ